jgi:hypothetical protein
VNFIFTLGVKEIRFSLTAHNNITFYFLWNSKNIQIANATRGSEKFADPCSRLIIYIRGATVSGPPQLTDYPD